jgi:hypothetical protein
MYQVVILILVFCKSWANELYLNNKTLINYTGRNLNVRIEPLLFWSQSKGLAGAYSGTIARLFLISLILCPFILFCFINSGWQITALIICLNFIK